MRKETLLILSLILVDQVFKTIVESVRPELDLLLFRIHLVTNTGASFGMLQGNNAMLGFVSLMVLGLIMMNIRSFKKHQVVPVLLIVSGLLSNLADRVVRGYVVDYFDLGWFPVFNLADSAITIGAIWLAITMLKD